MYWKPAKTAKLMRRWWRNGVQYTPLFVRFIPTDRCNPTCYSNCAFNSAYYARNLHVVAFKYLTG